ncbi:MAG TPA: ABC transporter ATP-binding protein [Bacteroidota bacterium]|nr:ABC transporter ATP-binding protein [Bacteroidota bacterium]
MELVARQIRFAHRDRLRSPREVFRDLALTVPSGAAVGILGREGSGKTTLLNILGGLLPPDDGTVCIGGIDLRGGSENVKAIRLSVGFTFQFPEEQFLRPSVREEFSDLLRIRGVSAEETRVRMDEALALMGLDPGGTPARSPFSLSLGESRRLALALLFALRPGAAFLDEPTAGLDASGVLRALDVLGRLHGAGNTVLVATHDIDFIAEFAERVLILSNGAIAADGKSEDVLADTSLLSAHGYRVPEVVTVAEHLRKQGRLDAVHVVRRKELLERCKPPVRSGDAGEGGGGEK